jgi:hypothetical protein
MKRSSSSQTVPVSLRNESDTWSDIAKGTPIKIKGKQGKWKFMGVERSESGEVTSISAYGGTLAHEQWRSFVPENVTVL